MSDYGRRWDELQRLIRVPEEQDLASAGANGAEQAKTTASYSGALENFRSYCDLRKQSLDQALWAMASSSGTPETRQSAWQALFAAAATAAQSTVMAAVATADERSPALLEFAAIVAQEECQFFLQLGQIPLSRLQGKIISDTEEFKEIAEKLRDQWRDLGDDARTAGEKAQEVLRQIRELVYNTVKQLVDQDRGLQKSLKNVKPDPAAAPETLRDALKQLLKAGVYVTMNQLEMYTKPISGYVTQLTELAAKEERFVIQFTEIRAAVAEFLQGTNLNLIAAEYNEAKAKALELAVDSPTSGSREDAVGFVQDALGLVDPLLHEFNRVYTNFVDNNRGIFVSYVDMTRLDELLKLSVAQSTCEDLENSNIEATLNELLEHTVSWEVSIEGVSDEEMKDLQSLIRTELEPLSHGIVEANQDRYIDIVRRLIRERVLPQRQLLEESKGASV